MSSSQPIQQDEYVRRTSFDIDDLVAEVRRQKFERRLLNAGPIFRNHNGESVHFRDLDFDLMAGLLFMYTRPIQDREAFMRGKESVSPRRKVGRWLEDTDEGEFLGRDDEDAEGEGMDVDDTAEAGDETAKEENMSSSPNNPSNSTLALSDSATTRPRNRSPQPIRTPYEIFTYTDENRKHIQRKMPAIERCWHSSKIRKASSLDSWRVNVGRGGLPVTAYAWNFSREAQSKHKEIWRTEVKLRSSLERILE